jgi:uncharacterized protein (DUF433 family)
MTSDNKSNMEILPGISKDPALRFGKPCPVDTRINVATIIGPSLAVRAREVMPMNV